MSNCYIDISTAPLDLRLIWKPLGHSERQSKTWRNPRATHASERRVRVFARQCACLVAKQNKGSLDMVSRMKGTKPSAVKGPRSTAKKKADGSGYKLHLAMDKQSYGRLVWLQGALRATSFGEVLRRALDAYKVFDPEFVDKKENGVISDSATSMKSKAGIEHLYVIISLEMKEQLDEDKSAHNWSYKETVSRALCVLMQLVREREKLLTTKEGGNHAKEYCDRQSFDLNDPKILATF